MEIIRTAQILANNTETPFYLYSEIAIKEKINLLRERFPNPLYEILYAMKANSNPEILKIIIGSGIGIDACSIEELQIAQLIGTDSNKIYYNADCLTDKEIDYAVSNKLNLVVGSIDAIEFLAQRYSGYSIHLRVNSGVGSGHSDSVVTNGELSKFGVSLYEIDKAIEICAAASISITGIHSHIGSGDLSPDSYIANAKIMVELSKKFTSLKSINFGGGFGFDYKNGQSFDLDNIFSSFHQLRESSGIGNDVKFILEPGRYLVASSGSLIARVCSVKNGIMRKYIGLDTGFNHFARCFLYNAWHEIVNITSNEGPTYLYDVVGNLCQSGDVFARQRMLAKTKRGDLICIKDTGAYGYAMSSNFNSRCRPAEYLIDSSGNTQLIRRAESIEDIINTHVQGRK